MSCVKELLKDHPAVIVTEMGEIYKMEFGRKYTLTNEGKVVGKDLEDYENEVG